MQGRREAPEIRFWAKVDPCRTDGCMIWIGALTTGYGSFRPYPKKHMLAHHFLIGKAPEGLEWDHLCRNRACVYPEHLEAVTHVVNLSRAPLPSREFQTSKTHCPQGHEYNERNTYVYRGHRCCRRCHADRVNARRWKMKGILSFQP